MVGGRRLMKTHFNFNHPFFFKKLNIVDNALLIMQVSLDVNRWCLGIIYLCITHVQLFGTKTKITDNIFLRFVSNELHQDGGIKKILLLWGNHDLFRSFRGRTVTAKVSQMHFKTAVYDSYLWEQIFYVGTALSGRVLYLRDWSLFQAFHRLKRREFGLVKN